MSSRKRKLPPDHDNVQNPANLAKKKKKSRETRYQAVIEKLHDTLKQKEMMLRIYRDTYRNYAAAMIGAGPNISPEMMPALEDFQKVTCGILKDDANKTTNNAEATSHWGLAEVLSCSVTNGHCSDGISEFIKFFFDCNVPYDVIVGFHEICQIVTHKKKYPYNSELLNSYVEKHMMSHPKEPCQEVGAVPRPKSAPVADAIAVGKFVPTTQVPYYPVVAEVMSMEKFREIFIGEPLPHEVIPSKTDPPEADAQGSNSERRAGFCEKLFRDNVTIYS